MIVVAFIATFATADVGRGENGLSHSAQ